MSRSTLFAVLFVVCALSVGWSIFGGSSKVDFNTEIKPIINKKCIACHGGVKQQGGFSLLFREEAVAPTKSGKPAIIPGDAAKSELIRRIKEKDPEERMPYLHEPLSKEEITLFEKWIDQGAQWGIHWAYTPVKQQNVPSKSNEWIKNDVDAFMLEKLKAEGLKPSAEADKATLLRRASLDILGMPAPESLAKAYLIDNSDDAYEKLLDGLLAQSTYGEKWTSMWLDLVRYADSKGYEKDNYRNIWRYKDWLIKAWNQDMPYDEFLTQQLAGDLLPNQTDDMLIATAMHRNTMTNDEGGTDNEEFRTAAVIDRVNTTWSSFMGTSFNCVQCHSHPYDPFKHEEYYQFLSFFNNDVDVDLGSDMPYLRHFAKEDSTKVAEVSTWLKAYDTKSDNLQFLKMHHPRYNAAFSDQYDNAILYNVNTAGFKKKGSARVAKQVDFTDKNQLTLKYRHYQPRGTVMLRLDSLRGREIAKIPVPKTIEWNYNIDHADLAGVTGKHDIYLEYNTTENPKDDVAFVVDWLRVHNKVSDAKVRLQYDTLVGLWTETTPILQQLSDDRKRTTRLFERGSWLSPGKEVTTNTPAVMNPMPANAPKNRLGLAMWMTDKANPLVSRTMVNRVWEQIFGTGLVETLEDLGTQGMLPTHAELLDHLSYDYMHKYKWSTKALIKDIMMSATYRQSSAASQALLEKDPYNKLYARGSRIRLNAEQVRDQNLAVSKLMNSKMYGKPVMPYQPDKIWNSPYSGEKWVESKNGEQYRRSVYTHWKRAAPYPAMINFDGVSREVCSARRIRTNTPLQALTTLNDESHLQMARAMATYMKKVSTNPKHRIGAMYRNMLHKDISNQKLDALDKLFAASLAKYQKNSYEACLMSKATDNTTDPEHAALVVVSNAMLNLDEWLNKN